MMMPVRIRDRRTKGSSFGLGRSLAQGFFIMRWEQDARDCFSLVVGTWLHNGKEHGWLFPRPQAEFPSEREAQLILGWSQMGVYKRWVSRSCMALTRVS